MNTHHHSPHRTNPWNFRIRLVLLIVLLTLGVGTAAVEKWRQEDFARVGNRIHDKIAYFLNPISERTHKVVIVAFKINELFKVEEEKTGLLRQNSELNIKNQLLAEELLRINRLAGLGHWSGPTDLMFLPADVTGLITSGQSAALIINCGRAEGVRAHDPVVALEGLVGIVQSVALHTAKVQAITDPISNVGVMDSASRARGVIIGRGRNELMEFMPENEVQPINIGGVLITSGFENSVFPKGIVVGMIQDRKLNTYGMTYGKVKPAASFEALEEVLLVIPKNRLAGTPDATTATLGVKRIFMPATLTNDRAATATTTTLPGRLTDRDNTATSGGLAPPGLERAPQTSGTLANPANLPTTSTSAVSAAPATATPRRPTPTPRPTPKATPKPQKTPAPPARPGNGEIRPEDFSR